MAEHVSTEEKDLLERIEVFQVQLDELGGAIEKLEANCTSLPTQCNKCTLNKPQCDNINASINELEKEYAVWATSQLRLENKLTMVRAKQDAKKAIAIFTTA